jgi:S-adenosylmethionine:tRNA ribosyltransferase-isomerase
MYLCLMFIKPKLAIEDFDYPLPDERIAYTPAANRADSKLLVWDQAIIAESNYANIASYIPENATLLFNNSKVIAARILFDKINVQNNRSENIENENEKKSNSVIEIFCLEPTEKYTPVLLAMQATQSVEWNCLVGGAKKWKDDLLTKQVVINNEPVLFSARKIKNDEGKFVIEFSWDHTELTFSEILAAIGNIPLPPYIQRKASDEDKDRYQTTYAIEEGSVAAPTAGLHFSKDVFESLNKKNIAQQYLTLHVGAGTFMPVKSNTIDQHTMHAEFVEVDRTLIQFLFDHFSNALNKKINSPIIAVGTTSLRTIESVYWIGIKMYLHAAKQHKQIEQAYIHLGQWEAYELEDQHVSALDAMMAILNWLTSNNSNKLIAKTQLMVTPGYQFKICDGLVTNFHQPKSTLLLIIAAIAGNEWKTVYEHALNKKYRFLSYGDGCLFWIKPQVK